MVANVNVSGVLRPNYCGVACPLLRIGCAFLLLVTFALDDLVVSQATEHQNAPVKRLDL